VSFSIKILGSSSAVPTLERYPTAHLLNADEHFYLIDCGEATQIQLRKYICKLGKINNIFISHLHGDHVFGLYGLLSTFTLLERNMPLNIFAHVDMRGMIDDYINRFGKGITFNINVYPIRHRKREIIYEDDKVSVLSFPLKHSIPVNGFVFREKKKLLNIIKDKIREYNIPLSSVHKIKNGDDFILNDGRVIPNNELTNPPYIQRSYAFCTDTAYYERMVQDIKGVDCLYHEATFTKNDLDRAKRTFHSTSVQAAEIAKKAEVKKLLIGHFSARYKNDGIEKLLNEARNIFPETYLANEGDIHKIDLKRMTGK